jgi:terminase small subunit / prophage DNA-packing protein
MTEFPHLTSKAFCFHTTPRTPRGVVVWNGVSTVPHLSTPHPARCGNTDGRWTTPALARKRHHARADQSLAQKDGVPLCFFAVGMGRASTPFKALQKKCVGGSVSEMRKNRMNTISVSEFAELVGVSTRTVSDAVKRGIIRREAGGLPHPTALQKYVAHLRETAAGRGGSAASEVSTQRAKLLAIQTARAQARFDREQGELVTISDVERNWASALSTLRAGVLAIPTRCAARVPGMTREIVYEMDQEIREALTELGRNGYPEPVAEERKTTP